jgi:hypothetical protein
LLFGVAPTCGMSLLLPLPRVGICSSGLRLRRGDCCGDCGCFGLELERVRCGDGGCFGLGLARSRGDCGCFGFELERVRFGDRLAWLRLLARSGDGDRGAVAVYGSLLLAVCGCASLVTRGGERGVVAVAVLVAACVCAVCVCAVWVFALCVFAQCAHGAPATSGRVHP